MAKRLLISIAILFIIFVSGCTSTTKIDQDALDQLIQARETLAAIKSEEVTEIIDEETTPPTPTTLPEGFEIVFEATQSFPDPTNLIQNGYFLEDYDYWTRDLTDEGGSSKISITKSNNSIVDRALKMEQSGKGNLMLSQRVPINGIDLSFSATFHTTSSEGLMWGFSGTGYAIIGLGYIDINGESLGFTRIMNVNESIFAGTGFVGVPDSISDTNTEHNIMINSGELYSKFSLDLKKEIESNLLGIDSSKIAFIDIVLIVGSNDKDAGASLLISDIVLH